MSVPSPFAGLSPHMVAQPVPRPPTPEQLAEVEFVRHLQIRTEAVRLAIAAGSGGAGGGGTLLDRAEAIERYLTAGRRLDPA